MANETLSYTFILIGFALLGGGVYAYFRQRAKIARSMITDGVVVELLPQRAMGDYIVKRTPQGTKLEKKYLYRPLIRFKTHDGRTIHFAAAFAARPPAFEVGDCVEVIYDPDQPEQAQINSFFYLWFYVIMLVFWGLFVLGMGFLGITMYQS